MADPVRKPWEKYQAAPAATGGKPWEKYGAAPAAPATPAAPVDPGPRIAMDPGGQAVVATPGRADDMSTWGQTPAPDQGLLDTIMDYASPALDGAGTGSGHAPYLSLVDGHHHHDAAHPGAGHAGRHDHAPHVAAPLDEGGHR